MSVSKEAVERAKKEAHDALAIIERGSCAGAIGLAFTAALDALAEPEPEKPKTVCATCKYEWLSFAQAPCSECARDGIPSHFHWTPKEPEPRRMQANHSKTLTMTGLKAHCMEHDENPLCANLITPCKPVEPKPRWMQANPALAYMAPCTIHGVEHPENGFCAGMIPPCKPVATPDIRDDSWRKTPEFGDEVASEQCPPREFVVLAKHGCWITIRGTNKRSNHVTVGKVANLRVTSKAEIRAGDCVRDRKTGSLAKVNTVYPGGDNFYVDGDAYRKKRSDLILVARGGKA